MDKMIISSRFTLQSYDFQKNLQNFCDCFSKKAPLKPFFCDLYLTFRIVGQLPTHQKIRLENCPSSCILLFRCGQREQVLAGNWELAGTYMRAGGHADGSRRARRWKPAGTQMEVGGHADGSRRAPTWKPAGTHMEAGVNIHISDYRYTVFER
ncbi:MAG: hypothetical protein PUI88_00790 [Prevotella sp.]|nr:hypothetical protein [Prevotella sp.]